MVTKSLAKATINFLDDGGVNVELDTYIGVNPRKLNLAYLALRKTYRRMVGEAASSVEKEQRRQRELKAAGMDDVSIADRKWHEEEDARLLAAKDGPPGKLMDKVKKVITGD